MRITVIANGFQEGYIVDLINGLASSSHDSKVTLIGSSFYPLHRINDNIAFKNLRGDHDNKQPFIEKIFRNLRYYKKLLAFITPRNTDMVHVQWLNLTLIDGILIPLFFRIRGIKVCYTAHDVLPHSRDSLLNRLLFYFIYHTHHHLVVHTGFIKSRIAGEFRVKPEKITVIRHGIYTITDNPDLDKAESRKQINLDSNAFVLLFFGIITKYKGLNILLEAFSKLNGINNACLLIAGKVDEKYRSEYDELLERYNHHNIRVFEGHIQEEKMQVLFKAADVTVLPYLEASQSGVMFMSYTFGRPVIAPAIGGFPDDIVEMKTGYLFNAGDPDSLAKAINRLYNEMDYQSTECGELICNYTTENYSWKNTCSSLWRTYSKILNFN